MIKSHLSELLPMLAILWDNPPLDRLNSLAENLACPVRFIEQGSGESAEAYEHAIHANRLVPTRTDNWHDLFNVAMWLLWPCSKLALNAAHVAEMARTEGSQRNRRRDALTLLDEAGVVIVSADERVAQLNRDHQWEQLFWHRRAHWPDAIQPRLIGHGLAEQCLKPYLGLTGKAVHLTLDKNVLELPAAERNTLIDQRLAERIESNLSDPSALFPLPVLGIPGWHPDNGNRVFYQNTNYFRPARSR